MKEAKTSATYFPEIHAVSYEAQYRESPVTSGSLMNDAGRSSEKLDGSWNFSIDQYNSFLRSKWFLEGGTDEHGMIRPPDYDFDRWETVPLPSCWNMTAPEYLYYEGGGRVHEEVPLSAQGGEGAGLSEGGGSELRLLRLPEQTVRRLAPRRVHDLLRRGHGEARGRESAFLLREQSPRTDPGAAGQHGLVQLRRRVPERGACPCANDLHPALVRGARSRRQIPEAPRLGRGERPPKRTAGPACASRASRWTSPST